MKSKLLSIINLFIRRHVLLFLFQLIGFQCLRAGDIEDQSLKEVKVSIFLENATLVEIFKEIEASTKFNFVYDRSISRAKNRYMLSGDDRTLEDLLLDLAKEGNLQFQRINRSIFVKRVPEETPLENRIKELDREIQGKVSDESGEGLPGATVIEVNTTNGTVTDIDGNYRISVSEGAKLRFSFVGFVAQEVSVNGRQVIDVQMRPDARQLDEVVVTGYQNIAKSQATGSSQQVDNSVLDIRQAQNIFTLIEGEMAGIVLDEKGTYAIRGISTFRGNAEPLVVVDGFPLDRGLAGLEAINPNNVESVTILKDAAAAAIWGGRASNGVIVITTKRGQKGRKPFVEFSTSLFMTLKYNLNDLPYAPTSSLLEFEKYAVDVGWVKPSATNQTLNSRGVETYFRLKAGEITQSEADAIISELEKVDSREEFSRLFMDNQYWQQYNLAISGGGQYNTYRASVTYNKNENKYFFVGNNSDQLQTTFNSSINLMPKLTLETDVNFNKSNTRNNGMSFSDFEGISQYQKILDEEGNYVPQQEFQEQLIAQDFPYNWDYNLKQEFDNKNNSAATTVLRIQTSLQYDIIEGLSIQGRYQYQWGETETNNLFNENTYRVRDLVNRYTYLDPQTNELTSAYPKGHILERRYNKALSHSGRLQLNFNRSFLQDRHRVNAIAGYERRQEITNRSAFTRYGYDPQTLISSNVSYGTEVRDVSGFGLSLTDPDNNTFGNSENRYISYYSNVNYTYLDKYSLSGSIRLDDANLFGASEKYRNIPLTSIGGRWDLSQERFMKATSSFLDQLSLRATYGSNGNVDTNSSPFLVIENFRNYITNVPFASLSNPRNRDLRFEKTFTANYAADFSLWSRRVSGSIEYYDRKSQDLLTQAFVPASLGYTETLLNVGNMRNNGVDINLNWRAVQAKKFSYSTTFNFSFNQNRVVAVDTSFITRVPDYLSSRAVLLNQPIRPLYSYQYKGLDSKGYPQIQNKDGELVSYRGRIISDELVRAEFTGDDLVYNGTTTPPVYGSWINEMRYKGFFLRTMVIFKFGHVFKNRDILNYRNILHIGDRDSENEINFKFVHKHFDSRWKVPGDEEKTFIPRPPLSSDELIQPGYTLYYSNVSQWVETASHIRFREIVFGYGFSNELLDKIGMQSLRISLQARNLGFIAFNKWKKDPENIIRPLQPAYTFNLTVSF